MLAIRLYCSQLEASFDSHLPPLIRPLFLVVYLVLVRFSWPAPLLGKHINRIHSCSVCFNKSGYGPIVHSHIAPTQVCLFLLPSKQSSGKSSIYGFCFRRREEDIKERDSPVFCFLFFCLCFFFYVRAFSVQRTRLSRSLEQAILNSICEHLFLHHFTSANIAYRSVL